MNKDNTYYEILIGKYLSGEADAGELAGLKAWIAASKENHYIFSKTCKAWSLTEAANIETLTNLNHEWEALKPRLDIHEEAKLRKLTAAPPVNFLRVAAILLLFIVPSVLFFWFFMNPVKDVLIAAEQSIESTLPDGTQVALNSGSSLQYPSQFKGRERRVSLKGEAYFEVTHLPDKPFVIEAGDMRVMVLGTSFYVNTNSPENTMEVVLMSGSVKLTFAGKEMTLAPGEKAVVIKRHHEIVKQASDDLNLLAWKTRVLRFNDTPLGEIVEILKNVYQKEIIIMNPAIRECRITATFEKQSLEAVLRVLQSTINIRVRANGPVIEISGEAC